MNLKNCTTEKLFSRLLENKTSKNERRYISELFKRPTQAVFKKCVHLTQSNDAKERIIGVDVLSQLGSDKRPFQKETVDLFFEMLKNEANPKIISAILYAISFNNEKLTTTHIRQIEKFQKSRNSDVRLSLVRALSECKHKLALDILIGLSEDRQADIRDWATFSIGNLSESNDPKLIAALWKRVNDKDEDTRFEAFVGLAMRKQNEIKKNIKEALELGQYGSLLFDAISALNDKEFLPQLEVLFSEFGDDELVNSGWLSDLEDCIEVLKKE